MNREFAQKLTALFQSCSRDSGENIVDRGRVSVGYIAELNGSGFAGVDFVCSSPRKAAEILRRVDDPDNWCGRSDVAGQMDDQIYPVNLKFSLVNPDYFHDEFEGAEPYLEPSKEAPYLETLVFSFAHPDSPAKIRVDVPEADLSQYLQSFKDFVGGPRLKEFVAYIQTLEAWSDLDFTQFCEVKPVPQVEHLPVIE